MSSYQQSVNWHTVAAAGKKFAYIKATQNTNYKNPYFAQQYNGAYNADLIRGAYHFAIPNASSGAAQANYFYDHGGGWTGDGHTLPGALDLEYNPSGSTCYGLSQQSMIQWIHDFSNTYKARAGRSPVIYTTTNWWKQCTGNDASFGDHPLWIARYGPLVGSLPRGWKVQSIWQNTISPGVSGDGDIWNGDLASLKKFATEK